MATLLDLIPKPLALTSGTAIIIPGHSTANKSDDLELTYGDLRDVTLHFRSILRSGQLGVKVSKGDVVATSLPNSLEFVVSFLGIGAARAISAPLNPAYSIPEFQFYLEDTKPALLFVPRLTADNKPAQIALEAAKKEGVRTVEFWIEGGSEIRTNVVFEGKHKAPNSNIVDGDPVPEDVTLVLHTSGTTGRPKSVPLSHKNLLRTTVNIIETYKLTDMDRSYLVMPLFHVHGLMAALLSSLRAGSSVVIPLKFSASTFWSDFKDHRCNWYTAVPTIHTILLASPIPSPLPKIRFIRSCSAALPPVTFHKLESTFKAPVLEAYAMTEAAHQMTSNPYGQKGVPGSVGVGVGVEVSIRDDQGREVKKGERGEVCCRGENVTQGYWNNEKANKESFWEGRWFRTGDQGLILPNGYLQLTGRIKELINRGGEKLAPLEIDAAILAVEGVAEAVCFGVEDAKYGEVVWAGVVLKPAYKSKGDKEEEKRIKAALNGKISKFKIPERILVTKAIPKTATGKIQRRFVKEAFVKLAKEQENGVKAKL